MLLDLSHYETLEADLSDAQAGWAVPADWNAQPATTTGEAVRRCRKLATALNAEEFSLFFCAPKKESSRLAPVFDATFPGISALSKTLSSRAADGFARLITEATQPFWWGHGDDTSFLTETARRWAIEIDAPIADCSGLVLPVSVEHRRRGVFVFAGNFVTLDEDRLCDLHGACFSLFEDVASQRAPDCTKAPAVSKRELECLRLTADGLTSEDIAAALGLSVHTANQYLTNAAHKLNAVNRIHAVAKALRCGLVD